MSPYTPGPRPNPSSTGSTDDARLMVDSAALHRFSQTQRHSAALVGAHAPGHDDAMTGLATTFGLIGFEFLGAAAEFLHLHQRTLEATARRQEDLATTTLRADAAYSSGDSTAEKGLSL